MVMSTPVLRRPSKVSDIYDHSITDLKPINTIIDVEPSSLQLTRQNILLEHLRCNTGDIEVTAIRKGK